MALKWTFQLSAIQLIDDAMDIVGTNKLISKYILFFLPRCFIFKYEEFRRKTHMVISLKQYPFGKICCKIIIDEDS